MEKVKSRQIHILSLNFFFKKPLTRIHYLGNRVFVRSLKVNDRYEICDELEKRNAEVIWKTFKNSVWDRWSTRVMFSFILPNKTGSPKLEARGGKAQKSQIPLAKWLKGHLQHNLVHWQHSMNENRKAKCWKFQRARVSFRLPLLLQHERPNKKLQFAVSPAKRKGQADVMADDEERRSKQSL